MPIEPFRDGASVEDTIAMLKKTLSWLMANLDHDNVKRLYTEYCQISSQAGETQISGPLILMYDKQEPPVLRRKIGYNTGSSVFVDEWYNPSGVLTAYIDTDGKLIVEQGLFKGNITTLLDAYIGKNLHLGAGGTSDTRVIYFNDYMNIVAKADGGWVIQFNCGYLDFIGAIRGSWGFSNASVSGLENSGYVKGTGTSGSFTTADGKTVTVSNGLITGIS
jgi:hypothetical protein